MDVKLGLSHRLKVLEDKVLRRVFGPRESNRRGTLHIEEPHYLYTSPSIKMVIKSRRMRGSGVTWQT
jgi:hypothetical protein